MSNRNIPPDNVEFECQYCFTIWQMPWSDLRQKITIFKSETSTKAFRVACPDCGRNNITPVPKEWLDE